MCIASYIMDPKAILKMSDFSLVMENKYEELLMFLSAGSYPSEYDKSQRQTLRRYAAKFRLKGQYCNVNKQLNVIIG